MLILASSSPRRKEIMERFNMEFKTVTSPYEESKKDWGNKIEQVPVNLAFNKAKAVLKQYPNDIIIGADTIVVIDKQILGKPLDEEEAFFMLTSLQNKKHTVISGVSIQSKDKVINFNCKTKVYFKKMSSEEIRNYIKTKEPMDKAGAYGIQGIGHQYIKKIKGDYYNVMGLPIEKVIKVLKRKFKK